MKLGSEGFLGTNASSVLRGLPWWLRWWGICLQCGRLRLIPWWEDPLENGMATHSSIFAWRIPWTEESSRLQSIGSQRVGHNWVYTEKPSFCWGGNTWILNWIIFSPWSERLRAEELKSAFVDVTSELWNTTLHKHVFYSIWNDKKSQKSVNLFCKCEGESCSVCVRLFVTPWTIQSMEFSRPEYWSHSLLQGIFPTQESKWDLLHCRQILYQLS